VYSGRDELESAFARALAPRPRLMIATRGNDGGRYETSDGPCGTWEAVPLPGPIADSYGSGGSFAAGLTYGLADGEGVSAAPPGRGGGGRGLHRPPRALRLSPLGHLVGGRELRSGLLDVGERPLAVPGIDLDRANGVRDHGRVEAQPGCVDRRGPHAVVGG